MRKKIEEIKEHEYITISKLLKGEHVKKGITPQNSEDKKGDIPLLTIKNILPTGTISYEEITYVSKEYFKKRKEQIGLDKGDIVIAITGATIGKLAIFNDDKEVAICGDIAKLTPKNREDTILIVNYLESELGQMQIKRTINGSTNFHLATIDIEEIVIPIFEEEREIKESLKMMNAVLEELKDLDKVKMKINKDKRQIIPTILGNSRILKKYKGDIKELEELLEKLKKLSVFKT